MAKLYIQNLDCGVHSRREGGTTWGVGGTSRKALSRGAFQNVMFCEVMANGEATRHVWKGDVR